jgi:hypothetical protein
MRFVIVRANLKETNKQLARLNDNIEVLLAEVYGIRKGQTQSDEPPEVSYSSDDLLLKEELEEQLGKLKENPADV